MKTKGNTNKFYILAILSVSSLLFLESCVFKKNNDKISNENKTYEQKILETQIDADLIVQIADLNLNTLNTLFHTKPFKFKGNKERLSSFKKFNYELKLDLNLIANKKLISIPNQYDIIFNEDSSENDSSGFTRLELENILKKQMDLFSKLQHNTSDVEILKFTIKSKEKLNDIDINI